MKGKNQNTDDMQAEQSRCLTMNFTINMGKFWITEVLDFVHHLTLKIVINNYTIFWKQISPCTQAKLQYCNTYRHTVCTCAHICVCECIHSHVHFTILLVKDRICLVNTYMHQIAISFLHYLWVYNANGLEKQIQYIQFCSYKINTI